MKGLLRFLLSALVLSFALPIFAMDTQTVVFVQDGFPAADTASPSSAQLKAILPGAAFADVEAMRGALQAPSTGLVVFPYGSAFPEALWPDLKSYLDRGGNLLVLGGRPFTRAAYRDGGQWKLRDYSVRFVRPLLIDQYQDTPGSAGLVFEKNPDLVTSVPAFAWKQAFSPVIHLSSGTVYNRGGSAGTLDANLYPLAWGSKDGRRLAAPILQIDHLRSSFVGGRWVFLSADLSEAFYSSADAAKVVPVLAATAALGSQSFTARPTLPLYVPGESVQIDLSWSSARPSPSALTAQVTITPEQQPKRQITRTVPLSRDAVLTLPAPATSGFHVIEAKLMDGNRLVALYRSGFWMRDESYLRSGPKLSLNKDYFELDGNSLAVVGTTYMASDVQRLFFDHPNAYVWDREMAQMHDAGLNMIRTGWWTGWDKFADETGRPYDRALRTLEAYLMTARKYGLPVQFNFFAFLPDSLGGINAYLDPEALRRQKQLYAGVAVRFKDVPFLAWDLINEPSFSQRLWKMLPNGDPIEFAAWNAWLRKQYPDSAALAHAWNLPTVSEGAMLPLPSEAEFSPRAAYDGANSLKVYDFDLFAQSVFADWAKQMRAAIRDAAAPQPVTVGQDEGGYVDRLSPAFFYNAVDFTANHSWWQNDHLLWDSLVAKQFGKPMLIQETGVQRELAMDEVARRSTESEGALVERKMAMSFVQGSGAIQWLWHTNAYMIEGNETPIGALRADATEKPEAAVMRGFAAFAREASPYLRSPQRPDVAIVTSQAVQFSALADIQIEAQRKAVRALVYNDRVPAYLVAENRIANLGTPRLVVLPSPQALNEATWTALLEYVKQGGNLLVTGPVARDPHWHLTDRTTAVGISAMVEPLTFRAASIQAGDAHIPMNFGQIAQNVLEVLRFDDAAGLKEQPYGNGRIFWASYPLELADGLDPAANLYSYVLGRVGIAPSFDLAAPLSTGVLVSRTPLADAVLYVIVSESQAATTIDLKDKPTGARLNFHLPPERAAVALVRKADGAVVAKYGF